MLPSPTLLSSNLLSSKLMHYLDLLHFFKLLHSSQLLPFVDLLPSAKLLSSELPSPTLLFIVEPCLAMPSSKVPSHQHSFTVHEFDFAVSFPPIASIISPIEHLISSSNVHVDSPMSLDKPLNLSDILVIESNPNLLHQCPPPQKLKKPYDCIRKIQFEWATKLSWGKGVLVANGILHNVRCKVCSTINMKPLSLTPKWDILMKHEGRRKANKDLLQLGVKVG